jgi:23S rRNA (guanine2445-N2)-methyltransferase / 23S rRNA (guanine2069-N7)-methyltransferase
MNQQSFFAICPGGLDEALQKEIEKLPAKVTHTFPGGVEFEGDLRTAYLANLKLRTASRVLLLLGKSRNVFQPEELYTAMHSIDWTLVFNPESTFAIYVTTSETRDRRVPVNHQFWALKAKDAVVDQFRAKGKERPNVSRDEPDITLRLHLHDQILKIYLDLSGPALHERGYRSRTLEAPMKENLAAGLLLLAGWQYYCNEGFAFLDPFCGSGTLIAEAALIATRTAPGLYRKRFGFFAWLGHDPELFQKTYEEVGAERILNPEKLPVMIASDQNVEAVRIAEQNLANAGLLDLVRFRVGPFEETSAPSAKGIIVTNPPYGVRLNELESLKPVYRALGSTLKHRYPDWTAGIITSEKVLLDEIGLKPGKKWTLHNGGLESRFSLFRIHQSH